MKVKQIVIHPRKIGADHAKRYGIVTDSPEEVYVLAIKAGINERTAKRISRWARDAEFGEEIQYLATGKWDGVDSFCRKPPWDKVIPLPAEMRKAHTEENTSGE